MSGLPDPTDSLKKFSWETQPAAWAFVRERVADFCSRSSAAAELAEKMSALTGTRFVDWVETIFLPDSAENRARIEAVGFKKFHDRDGEHANVFSHPGAVMPRVGLHDRPIVAVHLKVDSVADFAAVHQLEARAIEGEPLSPYRRLRVAGDAQTELWVAERWGWMSFDLCTADANRGIEIVRTLESFRTRRRDFDNDADGFAYAEKLIDASPLAIDLKCSLWFAAEREFWMRRNRAAQVQYARQQRLGLGWANHDHHTYRSSRDNFSRLVGLWEKLGFVIRERFYAGAQAGWGAQVMEQPITNIITFNDVDLSPDELLGDFAHESLPARNTLGTVGLWCGLHGDSLLQAGMHHLECQFDFDALREQLESEHAVKVMKPFSDFPYLRQAFTEGERWSVSPKRINRLLSTSMITAEQAKQFREQGAIGSHLENLERNDGFKGFNQTGVSEIISATDPRRHLMTK